MGILINRIEQRDLDVRATKDCQVIKSEGEQRSNGVAFISSLAAARTMSMYAQEAAFGNSKSSRARIFFCG
jgi:hypothetical protein